ncbi:QueT transporter family protein [Thermovorax subterraneus]|nr:QueT transporter family protein [Thermovorax subterraneus]
MGSVRYIVRASIIAGIYAALTYFLKPISYGPLQVRVAEALTLLPLIERSAVPGLFVGCFLANLLGGLGPWDIYGGSLITLVAAYLTSKMPNPFLGAIPPIILNALGVSYYLSLLYDMPYILTAAYIAVGEIIAVGFIGIPMLLFIERTGLKRYFDKAR